MALGTLAAVAAAFVWPLFAPGWIIPQGGGDLVSFLWPTYRYAARNLNLHTLTSNPQALLWNASLYSGYPFAADNQTGLFYPPNLLAFLLFPDLPYGVLEALVGLHLFLAGAGMYLLMRSEFGGGGTWRLEVGLVPAIAYMASDVYVTHLGNYNIVAVSAYLPIAILCLTRSLRPAPQAGEHFGFSAPNLRWSLAAGVALGLAALAGHAQMLLIISLACGSYSLWQLAVQRHWRVLVLGGLAAAVAAGLAAVALLPAWELIQYTGRSGLSYADAARWSLPPAGLAGMVSPLVFGRGARDFWPAWDRVEFGYMGALTLALLPLAFRREARFYWLLAAAGVLIAFGAYTPVHRLLFDYAPGFGSIRVPARFVLLTNFAFAALCGLALATWARRPAFAGWRAVGLGTLGALLFALALVAPTPHGRPLAWAAAGLALALYAAGLVLLRYRPALLPVLLFGELFALGGMVEVERADPNRGYERGPAVEYLLLQAGPFRIDLAGTQWQPDAPAVFGLESVSGIANPLALAHYDRFYWSVGFRGSPQYNFLNAQFVVADKDSPPADSTFVPVFNEDPRVDVYLNTNAMPRISLVTNAVYAASPQAAFDLVHDPLFAPGERVVLETRAPEPEAQATWDGTANLYYQAYAPGRFTVVVESPTQAYLVAAEVWYPGWRAVLNGSPVDIVRANSAFMAVRVPAGSSTVAFEFTSPWLVVGATVTSLTLAGLAITFLWGRRLSL